MADGLILIIGAGPTGLVLALWVTRAIQHLKLDILTVNWFSTYRVHHRVASHFRQGRTFLLGDAAHIHSPIGVQGMNTGIGDAVNLAWKLAMVLKEEAADNLLDTYEAERIVFARRLVSTTDRLFTIVTKRGLVARWVRTKLVRLAAGDAATGPSALSAVSHQVGRLCGTGGPARQPQNGCAIM
jgi:2-polyprenyl-6-methoxyphenol hydroxylase-like FAD-dependent oxidoreductase